MQQPEKSRIELLAPGGDILAVKAAIVAGADAVYCGLSEFNARKRADNITEEQLEILVKIAHQHDCRIYLTLNTLILEPEIASVVAIAARAYQLGVDAIIVQDLGLCYLLRKYLPGLAVHASTQMTTHSTGQCALLHAAGVKQVNVSRELSLPEITTLAGFIHGKMMRMEVFVHGAFCISFSGQCYMSCAMSGKSGNRGECVQPCRRIFSHDKKNTQGTPFNLKDNSAFAYLDKLVAAGVDALKIEGRIKGYKYVYATVAAWRLQLQRLFSGESIEPDDPLLHAVFNRRLSAGYLEGRISRDMFIDSSRDQSLVMVGKIRGYTADTGMLTLEREAVVRPDIPVLIYAKGFTFVCTGFLTERTGRFSYVLKITHKLKGKITNGDTLYQQADFDIPAEINSTIAALQPQKRPLRIRLTGTSGTPLVAVFDDGQRPVSVASNVVLVPAASRSLNREIATEKLGMLGETDFFLERIDTEGVDTGLFIPLSELNDLRRRGIARLSVAEEEKRDLPVIEVPRQKKPRSASAAITLSILTNEVSDLELIRAADTQICFELPMNAGEFPDRYRELFSEHPERIPWFPAIAIGRYYDSLVHLFEQLSPQRIVSDHTGIGWHAGRSGVPWIAGPHCNCTNSYTMRFLQEYAGCSGAFVSHELSKVQMHELQHPDAFTCWYTLFAPLLLMNTRQCIIRNCTGCKKEYADDNCMATCMSSTDIADDRNNVFHLVKRPGFYNQVYNHRHYFNPAVISDIAVSQAVVLIDIRTIPAKTEVRCSRQELIVLCEGLCSGTVTASQLREVVLHTTNAQYTRGI